MRCTRYTPQEGRNTTNFLIGITLSGKQKLDPAGFANGSWGGEFGALRDIYNFKNTINASSRNAARRRSRAALGFAETLEALMHVSRSLQTRDTLGADHRDRRPIRSISRRSSAAIRGTSTCWAFSTTPATKLGGGGAAFPFTLAPGFGTAVAGQDFTTTAGFAQFNRALKARVAVNYATLGGGAAGVAGGAYRARRSRSSTRAATTRARRSTSVCTTRTRRRRIRRTV